MNKEPLTLIRESFEKWYNSMRPDSKVTIAVNYSDVQRLSIKAIHTTSIEMVAIGIKDNMAFTKSIVRITENYNHGVTSEEEAKDSLISKLLEKLYNYR